MPSLFYKRSFLKVREELGKDLVKDEIEKSDITIVFELFLSPPKNAKKGSFRLLVPNYLISLEEDEDLIFQKIHKNTRYKINRAGERDELNYVELNQPTDDEIEEFKRFFNPFAKERNIRVCDVNKLRALRDQGALVISYITDKDDVPLCYHVYHKEEIQGYLIYSASTRYNIEDSSYRNLIGRANRYLHWKDIQSFKHKGCKWYNFGGKVIDEEDKGGQNVNHFKLEYGPIETGYDSRTFYAKSLVGKIGLFFLHLKWKKSAEYKFTKELGTMKTQTV